MDCAFCPRGLRCDGYQRTIYARGSVLYLALVSALRGPDDAREPARSDAPVIYEWPGLHDSISGARASGFLKVPGGRHDLPAAAYATASFPSCGFLWNERSHAAPLETRIA